MAKKHQTFISVRTDQKKTRVGTLKIELSIYLVEKNKPSLLMHHKYSTGSTRGEISEVMNALIHAGYIKGVEAGYYHEQVNGTFTIYCL